MSCPTNETRIDFFVLRTPKIDEKHFKTKLVYYEVKLTPNPDIACYRAKWINNETVENYMNSQGTVVGKGIVYTGNSMQYHDIVDHEKEYTEDQKKIMKQNMGINLISADTYLLKISEMLSVLN